jgi:hypothetical protein
MPITNLFGNGVLQGSFTISENVYQKHQERSADAGPATEQETPRCLGRKDRMRQQQNGFHKSVNLRRFLRNAILVRVLRFEKGDMHHEKIPDT